VHVGLKTRILPAGAAATAAASQVLAEGGLVAFPTETVYGLGADAANAAAIAHLYQAKGRPAFNPLIAHVGDLDAARKIARLDAVALRLAETFWPGPLTLVLPKAQNCPVAELATAGLDTVAVRIPAHPVARDILRAFGRAVVAPSANLSGHVSPTPRHTCGAISKAASTSSSMTARSKSASNPPLSAVLTGRCCCVPAACRARRSSA